MDNNYENPESESSNTLIIESEVSDTEGSVNAEEGFVAAKLTDTVSDKVFEESDAYVVKNINSSESRENTENFSTCNYKSLNNNGFENSSDVNLVENSEEVDNSEEVENLDEIIGEQETEVKNSDKNVLRLTRLPISRIKSIMKFDDDVHAASQEATFLVTKATELFIESFMKEVYQNTLASKKKTVSKKDVDSAIFSQDCFLFLDGALD